MPPEAQDGIIQKYYLEQSHSSLASYLSSCSRHKKLIQITTNSRLLTHAGRSELEMELNLEPNSAILMTLQQFDTELQFEKHLKQFMAKCSEDKERLLLIQSDVSTEESLKLIECAR